MPNFPAFGILSVRVTPVFSRRRRVAQRLERLLDTQEVGGSSPPVPTTRLTFVSPLANRRFARGEPATGMSALSEPLDAARGESKGHQASPDRFSRCLS